MSERLEKQRLVHWTSFEVKSDDPARDFEALCRSLVRLAFDGWGTFVGYKQQSGVEFYLRLKRVHPTLGKAGEVIGWQCKYFRRDGRALTSSQFAKIKDSYGKTRRDYPNVSKWILWTPEVLTKGDQRRICALRKPKHSIKEILFWNYDMILALAAVVPRASLLRTYFADYSFSREELGDALQDAKIPVLKRWVEKAHCQTDAEIEVRKRLLEPSQWQKLDDLFARVKSLSAMLRRCGEKPAGLSAFRRTLGCVLNRLVLVRRELRDGTFVDNAHRYADQLVEDCLLAARAILLVARREYRRSMVPLQNLSCELTELSQEWNCLMQSSNDGVLAVRSLPGFGKTHLAISVSAETSSRPAGFLILAKNLTKGKTIDEFVRGMSFAGRTFENVDALLGALDSVGRKVSCLMPVMIDGLNESEDPGAWRDILAALQVKIRRAYHHVRIVVTFRSLIRRENRFSSSGGTIVPELDYERIVLPEGARVIEIAHAPPLREMLERYFDIYDLEFLGGRVSDVFTNPLLLRVFCESKHVEGKIVSISADDMSDRMSIYPDWIRKVGERIVGADCTRGYISQQEYDLAIKTFARLLWEGGARSVRGEELDRCMETSGKPWNRRWERLLADEGLAMSFLHAESGAHMLEGLHDELSGYLIARHLMEEYGKGVLKKSDVVKKVFGGEHPLSADILHGLLPEWIKQYPDANLLKTVPPQATSQAFPYAMEAVNGKNARDFILTAWRCAQGSDEPRWQILHSILNRVDDAGRAFNGRALDEFLPGMTMAQRDSVWGVWVYFYRDFVCEKIQSLRAGIDKVHSEKLLPLAVWCKWLLVSNVPKVRDLATRILCEMGERDPRLVMNLVRKSIGINDLYLVERMMAVGYGVWMYLKNTGRICDFESDAKRYCRMIRRSLFGGNARTATSHYGVLNYAVNTLALLDHDAEFPLRAATDPFKGLGALKSIRLGLSSRATMGDIDLVDKDVPHMLGYGDYDTGSPRYKRVMDLIERRIFALGYRNELFGKHDDAIREGFYRRRGDGGRNLYVVEFGRKYSRIAYMEMKGTLSPKFAPWGRWHEVGIDPSFPNRPQPYPGAVPSLLSGAPSDMRKFLFGGFVPKFRSLYAGQTFADTDDEWVLVDGYLEERDSEGRQIIVKIGGFLTVAGQDERLRRVQRGLVNRIGEHYYSFHGETPWSPNWRSAEDVPVGRCPKSRPAMMDGKQDGGRPLPVERIVEWYNWESYHSEENDAQGMVLTAFFAQMMGLRIRPHQWEYEDEDGRLAARYCSGRAEMSRHELFYVRKDILCGYLARRRQVFRLGSWGERGIYYKNRDAYHLIFDGHRQIELEFEDFQSVLDVL